jgi:putative phage-type endonuclease
MTNVAVAQGSPAWLAARRALVTATDIPVLLGLSPYRCEADVADEKLNGTVLEPSLRMRVGSAVQDLIGEEYSRQTGRKVRRYLGLITHPDIEWAGASPDFRVVGEKRLVEAKRSSSRSRFADGLPQDVEAQVAWQLGVTGFPRADVAVLLGDDELEVFEVDADKALFADLVAIAEDFRARLAAGGPFSRDANRIKRDYPSDNGSEMVADAELTEAVNALVALRAQRKDMEAAEERIETAIKARMGEVATLVGQGFRITWKQSKSSEQVDWKSVADGLLRQLPESERQALVGIATTVRQGFRPFRVTLEKE